MSDKELEPYGFSDAMGEAVAKVHRLRQSHDRLLLALLDLVAAHEEIGGRYELADLNDFDTELIAARIAIRRAEEAK